jgi:large subunit ribosomal protein L4
MLLPLKNMAGQQVGEITLPDSIFAVPVNSSLMHQALIRQLANARLGTHDTKTRGEVEGGGKKPWRQKGTGRARQGSTRAPNFIGGGKVFGPTPHKYTKALPKKMQRAALRSALTCKAQASQIIVLDEIAAIEYKTKTMANMLSSLGIAEQRVLMVLADKHDQVFRSLRNLPQVTTLLTGYINVRDLLGNDILLVSSSAIKNIEAWLGEQASGENENEE